jgi:hypothetical protein
VRAATRNLLQRIDQTQAALSGFKRCREGDGLKMRARSNRFFDQAHAFEKNVMALAACAHAAKSSDERVLSAGNFFNEHENQSSIIAGRLIGSHP